jgi:hypothetical protein
MIGHLDYIGKNGSEYELEFSFHIKSMHRATWNEPGEVELEEFKLLEVDSVIFQGGKNIRKPIPVERIPEKVKKNILEYVEENYMGEDNN